MSSNLSAPDELDPLPPGSLFHGRYRVVRRLGRGAMGLVYEVRDERTNGSRALKVMLPSLSWNDEARERFQREASMLGGVESEHVVRVSDAGMDGEISFVAMELLRGETLQALSDRSGALPTEDALLILMQIARALARTSAAGIVHRDIKPENVFITARDDGSLCAKVLDFGLAKAVRGAKGAATRVMGTPLYMSPEQVSGDGSISPRSDHYALAHVAYTLLVGEPYWRQETERGSVAEFMLRIATGIEEPPSSRARRRRGVALPPAVDAWFGRAAAVDPASRFASPIEQIEALAGTFGGTTRSGAVAPAPNAHLASPLAYAETQAIAPAQSGVGRSRRALFVLAAIGALLAATAGVVAALVSRPGPAEKRPTGKGGLTSAAAGVADLPRETTVVERDPTAPQTTKCVQEFCAPLVVPNLARVELPAVLDEMRRLVATKEPSAVLDSVMIDAEVHDGAIDLNAIEAMVIVTYALPQQDRKALFMARRDWIAGHYQSGAVIGLSVAKPPACGLREALSAAFAAGAPRSSPAKASYAMDPVSREPRWYFHFTPTPSVLIDESCEAKVGP